jgi:hypothetical protein
MAEEKTPGQGWEQTTVAERRGRGGRGTPVGTEFYTATLRPPKRPEATPSRGSRTPTQPIRVVVNNKTGAIDLYEVTNTGDKIFNRFDPSKGKWEVPSADTDAFVRVQNSLGLEGLQRLQNDARRGAVTGVISQTSTEEDKNKIFAAEGYASLSSLRNPDSGGEGEGGGEGGIDLDAERFVTTTIEANSQTQGDFGGIGKIWEYPLKRSDQDVIKFTMIEYTPPSGLDVKDNRFTGQIRKNQQNPEKLLGTVILPIQPTIVDNNSVGWQQDTLNPIELAALDLSLGAITGGRAGANESIERIVGTVTGDQENVRKGILAGFASGALGKNVLARVTGAILNPNIELLFNAPILRSFNYRFQLSAREKAETDQILGIIGWFKRGMAVRRTPAELFLSTPNVFNIQYLLKGPEGKDHPYINRIKTCALTNCSVDYTPTGSYMTFGDGSMVSYTINLTFEELEPIYQDDYEQVGKQIGY